jgi:hypothetical protein
MNRTNKFLAATSLSATMLFSSVVQAMEIWRFDKMAGQDQDEYVGDLIEGAEKVLTDDGEADQATRVRDLFALHLGNDQISLGMTEFQKNLARARLADVERVGKEPNARRLEVEDALAVTLKKNGIDLPRSFFTVMKDFKPKHTAAAKDKSGKN